MDYWERSRIAVDALCLPETTKVLRIFSMLRIHSLGKSNHRFIYALNGRCKIRDATDELFRQSGRQAKGAHHEDGKKAEGAVLQ